MSEPRFRSSHPVAALLLAAAAASAAGPAFADARPAPAEPDPERILRSAAERHERIEGFCAAFSQERVVPLLDQTTRSRGTLCQKHPAFFLMEFDEPEGDRVVADGEHLWLYYPSANPGQVIRAPLGGPGGRTFDFHREFLDDPAARFEVSWERRDTVTGRATHVIELVPREPAGYERARIWVEADRGFIRKVEIEEENGSLRTVVLSDIRVDPGLDPSRFEFTPPPGVDVIERQRPGPVPGR